MSTTCALYSFIGMIFCGWVALLLQTQPFYITGLEDTDEARFNALGAAGLFLLTLLYSLYKIQFPGKSDMITPEGEEGYHLNHNAPIYGSYT